MTHTVSLDEVVKARLLRDPEFARAYARSRRRHELARTWIRLRAWMRERLCPVQARLDRYVDVEYQQRRDRVPGAVKDAVIQAAIGWAEAWTNVVICDWGEDRTPWEQYEREAQRELLDAVADLEQAMADVGACESTPYPDARRVGVRRVHTVATHALLHESSGCVQVRQAQVQQAPETRVQT